MPLDAPVYPPTGSIDPGDLYVDLQTRRLWLGVPVSPTYPQGSVLISDLPETVEEIDTKIADSLKDNKYYGRRNGIWVEVAQKTHTHDHDDITDWTTAVQDVVEAMPAPPGGMMTGMISIWAGKAINIGSGAYTGWMLCDGRSLLRTGTYAPLYAVIGTTFGAVDSTHFNVPNLKDRFILGSGGSGRPTGTYNSDAAAQTDDQGGHTHTLNTAVLSTDHLPSHTHKVTISGTGNFETKEAGDHSHNVYLVAENNVAETYISAPNKGGSNTSFPLVKTSTDGKHKHPFTVTLTSSGTSDPVGKNVGHTHTVKAPEPDHHHVIASADLREATPYLALAYIIKL